MRQFVKVFALSVIILMLPGQLTIGFGQKSVPEKGKIIDTVRCRSNPKISYAIYLPASYSENKKWPVIFVFDPAARGKVAVSGFVQASEKLGYIIVCSNNSRNQLPWTELSEVINSMFTDVGEKFKIDPGRIYTSGFSGGSRVASTIALNSNLISGVIACGAGFSDLADYNNIPAFNYYELVGNRDMNYLEMCDLEKKLAGYGKTVQLKVFEGTHAWPSPELLEEAVEWMDLQAMIKGSIKKNPPFIGSQFDRYIRNAELLLREGKLITAAQQYEYIIKDFPDYNSAVNIKGKLDSLKKSDGYIKAVKSWDKSRSFELKIQSKLISALIEQVRAESLPDSIRSDISGQIRMLRNLEKGKDKTNQDIASRVLMMLNIFCAERGRNYFNEKKFGAASVCYEIQSLVEPENNKLYYQLAKTYSLGNETDKSLSSLVKAINLGYNDRESIEKEPAFIALKNEKRFRDAIKKLK